MGQIIEVKPQVVDGVALFDTDRSITGQDGTAYSGADATDATFPGRLANRLFESDRQLEHVFVASNQVVAKRTGGWSDADLERAAGIISEFFVFYPGA